MSSTQLTTDVLSNAKDSFEESKKRVSYLLDIHEEKTGTGPGRRPESLSALHMSAMVLITACWESYLETLLSDVFKFLLDSSNSHEKISNTLKKSVSDEIRKNPDDRRIWELTGDGWKNILKDKVKKKLDKFGSPSGENANRLFKQILGLENLSECWTRQNTNPDNIIEKLNDFLSLRNKIAHGEMDVNVTKNDVKNYLSNVENLVSKTEEKVKCHIEELLNN